MGGIGVGVGVGGIGVAVGGTGVAVGGTGVAVGGTGVAVGGIGVAVGGTGVAVGGTGVAVGGTGVAVGGTGVAVGGTGVGVGVGGIGVGVGGAGVAVGDTARATETSTSYLCEASYIMNAKVTNTTQPTKTLAVSTLRKNEFIQNLYLLGEFADFASVPHYTRLSASLSKSGCQEILKGGLYQMRWSPNHYTR